MPGPAPADKESAALLAEGRERRRAVGKVLVETLRPAVPTRGGKPARSG